MTPEDRQIVDDYMNWGRIGVGVDRKYDLNNAGLVVQEMQKRGDWITFVSFVDDYHYNADIQVEFTAWLFNAENFFLAFVEWFGKFM
jgi:hypothetical protein